MPAPSSTLDAIISHGIPSFRLEGRPLTSGLRQPDSLRLTYRDSSDTAHALGTAPADYSGLRIIEKEVTPDGSGYLHRLQCRGLVSDRYRWISSPRNISAEEGWNTRQGVVYTAHATDLRWRKGQRPQEDPIEGITGEADDEKLTKTNAFTSLSTGRMAYFDFSSGFTGLTTGTAYYVIKVDDSNIKLATTLANANAGTAINITADGTGGTLRPVISGHEYMWMTDREEEEDEAPDYKSLGLNYKGLIVTDEMPMGIKRRINTTAQALSTTNFGSAIVIDPVYTGPASNPSTSSTTTYTLAGNVEFDLPQISVTDTMISTSAPPTHLVPSNWIPDNAPTITVVSISGTNDIYHYPAGWKVLNLQSEQIPGQNLWLISLTWGYQRANTPQA